MNLLREYIRELLQEGAGAPKVIFMAGAPGSGKSTVIRNLGLGNRLELINPDDQYEETMRAEGVPMDRAALLDTYSPIRTQYLAAKEAGSRTAAGPRRYVDVARDCQANEKAKGAQIAHAQNPATGDEGDREPRVKRPSKNESDP